MGRALSVVDDFAPNGSTSDVQRMHRDADRVLRAQGNRAGRARCRADGTLRPARPPRGLVLSTGEDVPRGQSLRARLLVIEAERGDVNWSGLSACQVDAATGYYAEALAGYVRWLAPRYAELRADGLARRRVELRDRVLAEGAAAHARTPGIVADLLLGLGLYLDFAVDAGALDRAGRDALDLRAWTALLAAAAAQAEHVEAAEPCGQYLRLLAGALASGRAHVAGTVGEAPSNAAAWGWREELTRDGPRWGPQGRRIGWLDGDALYLEPEAAYAEAQRLAADQGESLPITEATLRRRLRDRGLLAASDGDRLTVKRDLEGKRRRVIVLRDSTLSAPEPGRPGRQAENPGGFAPVDCPDCRASSREPGRETGAKAPVNDVHAPPAPVAPLSAPIGGAAPSNFRSGRKRGTL